MRRYARGLALATGALAFSLGWLAAGLGGPVTADGQRGRGP